MKTQLIDIVVPAYNDEGCLAETLQTIFNQDLKCNWKICIYVVDDGSSVPLTIDSKFVDVFLIRLDENMGASVARNVGASSGSGDVVLFLDADCSLKHSEVLNLLLAQYMNGFDVCFGQIDVEGNDFWGKYQREVAKQRAKSFIDGDQTIMSTAIFMVKRTVFESVGGFDERYHFGFEDRDLFISLIKNGNKATLVDNALVYHNDKISLESVTKKLFKSAQDSASRFIEKHPDEYMKMPYSKADIRFSTGGLDILVFITKPMLWSMVHITDWIINRYFLPYFLTKNLVKYLSGLAYLHGSYVSRK